jgi:hypothetical protein
MERIPNIFNRYIMVKISLYSAGGLPQNDKNNEDLSVKVENQRPPAERRLGPFQEPSSYPQLCWWSLIANIINREDIRPWLNQG